MGGWLGTGLRRHEVAAVRPEDVSQKDGKVYAFVAQGKGGKQRSFQVWGPYAERVLEIARARDGQERIFDYIHSHADVQSWRRQFALARYREEAGRPFEMRDYNREAISKASGDLGHGPERIDVILHSYVR